MNIISTSTSLQVEDDYNLLRRMHIFSPTAILTIIIISKSVNKRLSLKKLNLSTLFAFITHEYMVIFGANMVRNSIFPNKKTGLFTCFSPSLFLSLFHSMYEQSDKSLGFFLFREMKESNSYPQPHRFILH